MAAPKWDYSEPTFRAACQRGLLIGGHLVRNEQIRLITNTPKTGRVYRRRGVEHRASAPGEPPASDIGALVQSIGVPTPVAGALAVDIAVSAKHASYLEFGTTRMAPRPFIRPAADNVVDDVTNAILRELRAVDCGLTGGRTVIQGRR